jgi:hypothetical protein
MIDNLLTRFDQSVRKAFENMVAKELDDTSWGQAKSPLRLGGCALRCADEGADVAYISSRALTREDCKKLDSSFKARGQVDETCFLELGEAVRRINDRLPPEKELGDTLERIDGQWLMLGKWVEDAAAANMIDEAGQWNKARLNSLQAKHSASWLEGIPCQAIGTRLSGEEFRSRMGRRLGIEICEETSCPLCFETMDKFGAHAESCMGGGDAVARHNESRDTLHKQAKAGAQDQS